MVRLSYKGSFLPGSSHVRMIVRHFDSLRSDADLICDYKSLWNIEKTSFVVFHSPQRRIAHKLNLSISNMSVKSDNQVKYLGLIFDSNLNWKPYLHELSKKVLRGSRVLSKIRYYVNRNILHQLYYSIIYPFLTYGLSIWGNTYSTTLKPLITLQKRAIRTITFSKPDEHSEPLFKELEILKLTDLVTLHNALLMYHQGFQ